MGNNNAPSPQRGPAKDSLTERENISSKLEKVLKGRPEAINNKAKATDNTSTNENTSKKKILFVTAGLKGPTAGGGIATVFHSMIKTLWTECEKSVDVIYAAHPYYASKDYIYWRDFYKENFCANLIGLEVEDKNYGSKEMNRSFAILNYLITHGDKYSTVVFHDFMGLAYYPLLAKKQGIALQQLRIIISAHGNHTLSYFFGMKKISTWQEKAAVYMEKESLKLTSEITSPSYFYRDWLTEKFGLDKNKIRVIPNVIFKDKLNFELDIKFSNDKLKLIVFYGRLERLKGVDLFISAIKLINNKYPIHNVLFAGVNTTIDGVRSDQYIKKELENVKCEVKFFFNCSPSEIFTYVRKQDGVCIFPTFGENAPCVVVESILYGARFAASDIPGIKEMVSSSKHPEYLFKTGSLSELKNMLINPPPPPDRDTLSHNMRDVKDAWVKYLLNSTEPYAVKATTRQLKMALPTISVIVPTCNRPTLLEQAIRSLRNQSYPSAQIIIVDDRSDPAHATRNKIVADNYSCEYLYLNEKVFKGRASNHASKYATGEYLCFFDDDDIAYMGMLRRYVSAFNHMPEFDILSGFVDVFEHRESSGASEAPAAYSSLALGGGLEVNSHINFFGKGSFIIRAKKFHEIGGYLKDSEVVPMVDYRFYLRASLSGLRIGLVPFSQYMYRKNSPNSLFYGNNNKKRTQYLAKKSIEMLLKEKLGSDIGAGVASMVWDISLPRFN